ARILVAVCAKPHPRDAKQANQMRIGVLHDRRFRMTYGLPQPTHLPYTCFERVERLAGLVYTLPP
ncbi:MAG TPA: hypothetical protein VEI52_14720, partial [Terriglobales bacterium]|nr:hypothetical protein [Terriglobales bacterium]